MADWLGLVAPLIISKSFYHFYKAKKAQNMIISLNKSQGCSKIIKLLQKKFKLENIFPGQFFLFKENFNPRLRLKNNF